MKNHQIETLCIHAGAHEQRTRGAVTLPVFLTSNYTQSSHDERDKAGHVRYIRYGNTPNHVLLESKFSAIERTESAVVMGSGIAALSSVFLSNLKSGDHLLAASGLYGGTHKLLTQELPRFGIRFSWIDSQKPETWKSQLRPETRLIHVESISNPLMRVAELEAIVAFAREHGLRSSIDSTFTPAPIFRPAAMGFDFVIHSCSKFYNGHSDLLAGMVAGRTADIKSLRDSVGNWGMGLDPHSCFLLNRGLMTLTLRVEKQSQNALKIAHFLQEHPKVDRVYYPGLVQDSGHQRAKKWFKSFSSMLAFQLKDPSPTKADELISRLQLAVMAPSLGGVETLAIRPITASHRDLSAAEKKELGITDHLIRYSTGIESAEDLIADLQQALQ